MSRVSRTVVSALLFLGVIPVHAATRAEMLGAAPGIALSVGIPPDLLKAVCEVESHYNADKHGDHGKSIGLCQVQPGTAITVIPDLMASTSHRSARLAIARQRLTDWRYNMTVAALLLRRYLDRFGSEDLALVAYNGGEHHPVLVYVAKVHSARVRHQDAPSLLPNAPTDLSGNAAEVARLTANDAATVSRFKY